MITNPIFSTLFDNSTGQRHSRRQRRIGTIYNAYRIVLSLLFCVNMMVALRYQPELIYSLFNLLPTFGYLIAGFLCLFSYLIYPKNFILALGLAVDVIVLSFNLYFNTGSELQIALMFLVVVAASFMLVATSQAVLLTLFAVILVIYQQFFQVLAGKITFSMVSNATLMSVSFLAVAYLSWSASKRLNQIEQLSERQHTEVNALNAINEQVVRIIQQGVIVLTHRLEILIINETAMEQLQLTGTLPSFFLPFVQSELAEKLLPIIQQPHQEFVFRAYSQAFIDGKTEDNLATTFTDLRINVTQLGNEYALLLIEDLKREQSHAQQLKLASLGQLTASIAHEIRNPLATISQASQLLIEEAQDEHSGLSAENLDLYDMIFKQTKRMNQIIEDVLKLSRQAKPTQSLIIPSIWLPEFIRENFSGHDIFLHCHTAKGVYFDVFQLEQVLVNLVNNGLRFSSKVQPHAYVTIEVYEVGQQLYIDVIDTGAGVKPEYLKDLFNPFFTTDREGTGLGLYLSQAFCQANNANLHYVPHHEHTCFRISAESATP